MADGVTGIGMGGIPMCVQQQRHGTVPSHIISLPYVMALRWRCYGGGTALIQGTAVALPRKCNAGATLEGLLRGSSFMLRHLHLFLGLLYS